MLTDLILYDLKVAALIAVFYLFYRLLLARETTHALNRMVLLSAIALSAVLPLCVITIHRTSPSPFEGLGALLPVTEGEPAQTIAPMNEGVASFWGIWGIRILSIVVLTGVLVRLLYVLRNYWRLRRLMAVGERHTLPNGTRVCVVDAPVAPFSWMHTMVLSRADWLLPSPSILAHEEAHVRHRHSYDVVVVEVLTALQWFNPVVWFLRQELRTLHEYEADASVLSYGFDESQYIHLLMQKATGIQACALANGIGPHRTKKRILMMLKPQSHRRAWLKALYIVPVALASLAMTAKTVVDYDLPSPTDTQEPVVRVCSDNLRGEYYQIRNMPGVKFYHNGKEETIPGGRSIALEVSKTTLQCNGVAIEQMEPFNIPVGALKEIRLDEVAPDRFVANLITEETGKTVVIVNGQRVTQEQANSLKKEDIAFVDVIGNKEFCKKYDPEAEHVVLIQTKDFGDPVFEKCDQMPQFPGGDVKLMEYIVKNVQYPAEAKEHGVQGTILVNFIVEKNGSLSNVQAADGGAKVLSDEAIRVVKAMPRWTPGKQQGETVRCRFTIPVTFRLN